VKSDGCYVSRHKWWGNFKSLEKFVFPRMSLWFVFQLSFYSANNQALLTHTDLLTNEQKSYVTAAILKFKL
jgi:hypothetical protein